MSFAIREVASGDAVGSETNPPARFVVDAAAGELEDELRVTRGELQATLEAYESSNAELKASHEELTSLNEELQSSNEELETSKEELQSLNEELHTINAQLQAKILELETNNNDLSNLLSSTDVAVVFLDLELRVRRFTPAVRDLIDLIPGDIGRPVADLVQKFSGPDLRDDARAVIGNLVPTDAEVNSASGRWYLRRTLPYRTGDNRIDGIVVTFIDITARKDAERIVAEAQARMQAMIEQMPTAVVLVDALSGRLELANRRAATLFGHPFPLPFLHAEWAAAHAAFRGFHPDGRALAADEWPLARTLATGETVADAEFTFRKADGSLGWLLVNSAPVLGRDGHTVAAVSVFWDVTQRKAAEERLKQSEERFRLLVENARDFAIFMIDLEERVASWNVGAERMTGWSESEILGQPAAALFTPEDRDTGVPHREIELARRQGCAMDERWHLRKDGSRFWGSGTVRPVYGADKMLQGFVKIMRDMTERQQSEERLREALQKAEVLQSGAESANRAKDDFIATVSHELRTPLNTIRLWSAMLTGGRVPEQHTAEGIRMIDRAAQSQQQLIDDLLDVSRMATGKIRLQRRATLIIDALRAAVDAIEPTASARGITLQSDLSPALGVVVADPDRIQQIVWNLLSNAAKFSEARGTVTLRAARVGDVVEIRVVDNGIGIEPEFLPHVFDRFRQAEPATTRAHGGLGLGLAIARQLVELHGGEITAESEGRGRGAAFVVRLPLPECASTVKPDDAIESRHASVDISGVDVLLVEDDVTGAEAMRRLLESHGATVRIVESASAARKAIASRRPDVLLSDIGLPGENGLSLVADVRAGSTGTERSAAAIAISAFAREEDRQQALSAGFDEHLKKPVDPTLLLATIARLARRG